jgi:hypothetical protein
MRQRISGSIAAAGLCFGLLAAMAAPPALGQSDPNPPAGEAGSVPYAPSPGTLTQGGPIQDGRRVPFSREQVQERQRAAGIAADVERERRQLEELNAITRQLTPPGTPLPAPNLPPRGERPR